MTTVQPKINHSARCRRPAPVLRLSWRGEPERFCPACGRAAPAADQRAMATKEQRR